MYFVLSLSFIAVSWFPAYLYGSTPSPLTTSVASLPDVVEIQSLSTRLAELCTRVVPELDELYSDLAAKGIGLHEQLNLLKPLWLEASQRELQLQKLRSEKARIEGRLQGAKFAVTTLKKTANSRQILKHQLLDLSQSKLPMAADEVRSIRSELAYSKRQPDETWLQFVERRNKLKTKLELKIMELQILRHEQATLKEFADEGTNLTLDVAQNRAAVEEGRFNVIHGQLQAEEVSLAAIRKKVSLGEQSLGSDFALSQIPPSLPAICERLR